MDRWGVVVVGCGEDLMVFENGCTIRSLEDTCELVCAVGFLLGLIGSGPAHSCGFIREWARYQGPVLRSSYGAQWMVHLTS